MTRNESTLDRTVRLVLGAAAIVWAGMLGWSTAGGIVLVGQIDPGSEPVTAFVLGRQQAGDVLTRTIRGP